MTKTQRKLILEVIYQVMEEGAYANIALDKALSSSMLEDQNRGFITEIVYGTVRYAKRLDYCFERATGRKVKSLDKKTRSIIRMSMYQLVFMPNIPDYAIVDEAVNLAKNDDGKKRKRDKFINGVLRAYIRNNNQCSIEELNKIEALSIQTSLPEWIVRKWNKMYDYETAYEIAKYMNEPAPLWIRVNTLLIEPDAYIKKLESSNVLFEQHRFIEEAVKIKNGHRVDHLPGYHEGEFFVQDISSMHVAYAFALNKGDHIWDTCASPGGKTTHIAAKLNNQGSVLATDVHDHRTELTLENIQRLQLDNITAITQDALKTRFLNKFDKTLVDAPCSGLGVLNRRPDSRWRKSELEVKALIEKQLALLKRAIEATRPGGQIIYSTCTINDAENDRVVKNILKSNSNIYLDPDLSKRLHWLEFKGKEGQYTFLPPKDHTDGFFIASFIKEC